MHNYEDCQETRQATLDGSGIIILSKTGRPMCTLCGHFLSDTSHLTKEGVYRTTVWCTCICQELFNRDGTPKQLNPFELFRLQIYGMVK